MNLYYDELIQGPPPPKKKATFSNSNERVTVIQTTYWIQF